MTWLQILAQGAIFATFIGAFIAIAAYFNGKHIKEGVSEIGKMIEGTQTLIKETQLLIVSEMQQTRELIERTARETQEVIERTTKETQELIERTTRETRELIERMDNNMMNILSKISERIS